MVSVGFKFLIIYVVFCYLAGLVIMILARIANPGPASDAWGEFPYNLVMPIACLLCPLWVPVFIWRVITDVRD